MFRLFYFDYKTFYASLISSSLEIYILYYLQETKRPSKEMQVSIARQLSLQPTTVGNFFMNARRRLQDKWKDIEHEFGSYNDDTIGTSEGEVETSQCDEYPDRNHLSLNQELLVPDVVPQHLTTTTQQTTTTVGSPNQRENIGISSLNLHHGQSSMLEPPSIMNTISPVIPVTGIAESSIADQIVPNNNTQQEHELLNISKASLSEIGCDSMSCASVPVSTTINDDRTTALNPNQHQSVYSLTSL